jgi:hypothetical protein
MFARVIAAMCCVCLCSSAHADLIDPNFSLLIVPNDSIGWEVSTGGGAGQWQNNNLEGYLAGSYAEYDDFANTGTTSLSQTFTQPAGMIPGLVATANLSWTQFLLPDTFGWSASNRFRVLLSDQDANTLVAYTTQPLEPSNTGFGTFGTGATASANQAALVNFLNTFVSFGENLTLSFEVVSNSNVQAAVDSIQFTFTTAAVPEPGSLAITAFGLGTLLVARRRRNARQRAAR